MSLCGLETIAAVTVCMKQSAAWTAKKKRISSGEPREEVESSWP